MGRDRKEAENKEKPSIISFSLADHRMTIFTIVFSAFASLTTCSIFQFKIWAFLHSL